MSVNVAQVGLSLFAKLSDIAFKGKEKSLISATKGARFEPIVLIDSDVSTYDGVVDVMQSLQSIFTGYLLQAISLYGNVGGTKAVKELDRLNPSREPDYSGFIKTLANLESYKTRLPSPKGSLSLESLDSNPTRYSHAYKVAVEESSLKVMDNTEENLVRSANLSVGKVYNVKFKTFNGSEIEVPITVRLLAMLVPSERLTHILTIDASANTEFKERYYAWRAGKLSFISDLIFARDLIKQQRKELMQDKDGLYSNVLRRRLDTNLSTLTSGSPSLAGASNIVVMSAETAKQIEQTLGGKFSNYLAREGFFSGKNLRDKISAANGLMMMVVVDKFADLITFYSEGISESTTLKLRELKNNNKGGGPDVSEILKAYQLGSSPSTF